MRIDVDGKTYDVAVDRILAHARSLAPIARPLFVLGCERCGSSCSGAKELECACCKGYGKSRAGGAKSHPTISGAVGLFQYDPDAKKHRPIMTYAELEKLGALD